jgi:hypothetical protein
VRRTNSGAQEKARRAEVMRSRRRFAVFWKPVDERLPVAVRGGPMKSQQLSARTKPYSTPRRSAPEQQATNREVRDKQGWGDEVGAVAHLQLGSVGEWGRSR